MEAKDLQRKIERGRHTEGERETVNRKRRDKEIKKYALTGKMNRRKIS